MKHMESLTENWKQMAMQLDELDVHAKPVLWRCSSFWNILLQSNIIGNLEIDTISTAAREKCINGTRNNSSGVLCMEADIQYDI